MLSINIGDYRDGRRKIKKASIGFIRFGNHELALAYNGIATKIIDNAADDHGWIELMLAHERADKAGRRGFAMSSGYGNAAAKPHQLRKHSCPLNNRDI